MGTGINLVEKLLTFIMVAFFWPGELNYNSRFPKHLPAAAIQFLLPLLFLPIYKHIVLNPVIIETGNRLVFLQLFISNFPYIVFIFIPALNSKIQRFFRGNLKKYPVTQRSGHGIQLTLFLRLRGL